MENSTVLVVNPDKSVILLALDKAGTAKFDLLPMEPEYNLFFVSPSWIEDISGCKEFKGPEELVLNPQMYRFQYFPTLYPKFILKLYTKTDCDLKLFPISIAFFEISMITFEDLLDAFSKTFICDYDTISITYSPNNDNISLSNPIFDQKEKIRNLTFYLNIGFSNEQIKSMKKRENVINELFDTEFSYASLLDNISRHFDLQLFEKYNIGEESYSGIFKPLNIISPPHKLFINRLRMIGNQINAPIGQIFLEFLPYFKIEAPHIQNYSIACKELTNLFGKHRFFQKAVKKICQDIFDGQTPESLLIAPVQRLPRYPLFLREILKSTPNKHFDYQNLLVAIDRMNELVKSIDNQKIEQDQKIAFINLQKRFKLLENIVNPASRLVASIENIIINDELSSLYLFNDILFYMVNDSENFYSFYDLKSVKPIIENDLIYLNKPVVLEKNEEAMQFLDKLVKTKKEQIEKLCSFGKGLKWKYLSSIPTGINHPKIRCFRNSLFLISEGNKIYQFITDWREIITNTPQISRNFYSIDIYSHYFVIFGGINGPNVFSDLILFDLMDFTWIVPIQNGYIPCPRYAHASCVIGNTLIIHGGISQNEKMLENVYLFDFITNVWKKLDIHSIGSCAFHFGFNFNNQFAIYGGMHGNEVNDEIFMLNDDKWTLVRTDGDSPVKSIFSLLATINNTMYVIGGIDSKDQCITKSYKLTMKNDSFRWDYLYQIDQPDQIAGGDCTNDESQRLYILVGEHIYYVNMQTNIEKKIPHQAYYSSSKTFLSYPQIDYDAELFTFSVNRPESKFIFDDRVDESKIIEALQNKSSAKIVMSPQRRSLIRRSIKGANIKKVDTEYPRIRSRSRQIRRSSIPRILNEINQYRIHSINKDSINTSEIKMKGIKHSKSMKFMAINPQRRATSFQRKSFPIWESKDQIVIPND